MPLLRTLKFIIQHPLNRRQKGRALAGFLKWQIGSRLIPGQVIYDWINGAKIIVQRSETSLTGNIYCGLYEFPEMAFVLHAVEATDLFVDIGANVGSYTILACAAKQASGICIEPVPTTFNRLRANLIANDLTDRVEAYNLGVSDDEGELYFTSGENCGNHVVADAEVSSDVVCVKALPLDNILENKHPAMLKIDVEGFETPVLNGATETLSKPSLCSVILELNGSGARYGYDENMIISIMHDHRFSPYTYDPFSRELLAIDGKNTQSDNTLFIRDVDTVINRIKAAPRVSIGSVIL